MVRSLSLLSLRLGAFCLGAGLAAQTAPPLIGIGDSLGEGVQSANAFYESQPNTYLKRVATQMGVPFAQPLLSTSLTASIFNDDGRSRVSPPTDPADLAVSGATTGNVLNMVANTGTPATEYDLVLPPYYGMSEIQIVEQLKPAVVLAWVGNDDLISEVLNFDTLNDPKPTPLPLFTTEYQELVSDLQATGAKVVMANIPDLTEIGYLFDNDDLTRYTGTNYNLPQGYLTTLPTMILLKLGIFDASILQNLGYVLTPTEIKSIQQQVQEYNQVISETAASAGFPVVNAYAILNGFITNPITIEGITIGTHYNQGAFSLDGVHPSDTGYAVFAEAFITAANQTYNLNIPQIPDSLFLSIFNADPFIDFSGTGVVPGRPYTGLLESLGPFLGLSGGPGHQANPAVRPDPNTFMREYYRVKGKNPETVWTKQDVIAAVTEMVGLRR
jgi:hypothetical protein